MESGPILIIAASHRHIIISKIAFRIQVKILADYSDVLRIKFGKAILSSNGRNSDGLVCVEQVQPLIFPIVAILEIVVDFAIAACSHVLQFDCEVNYSEYDRC